MRNMFHNRASAAINGAVALSLITSVASVGPRSLNPYKQTPQVAAKVSAAQQTYLAGNDCDSECMEMVVQAVRLAWWLATEQYKRDRAKCAEEFAPESDESRGCFSRARKMLAVRFGAMAAAGIGVVLVTRTNILRNTQEAVASLVASRRPKITDPIKKPSYPEYKTTSGARVDIRQVERHLSALKRRTDIKKLAA